MYKRQAYFLVNYLTVRDNFPGFYWLLVLSIFFGGTNMLILGIFGEYLARIFEEVKGRPNFIVQSEETIDH